MNDKAESSESITLQSTQILEGLGQNITGSLRRPKAVDNKKEKDRRVPISLDVSLRYMESNAYKEVYGTHHVWQLFRRNFGNQFFKPTKSSRESCVGDDGFIIRGWPCPICRDEYLVIDYRNVKLIKQFINPFTGKVYPSRKTNVCQVKHEELLVAILKAKMYGTISYYVPQREYRYADYYLPEQLKDLHPEPGFDYKDDPVLQKALQAEDRGDQYDYAIENIDQFAKV